MTLTFTLREMGNLKRVLSREVIWFYFTASFWLLGWNINLGGNKTEKWGADMNPGEH